MEANRVSEVPQHHASASPVKDKYPAGFWKWFMENRDVYREFERRALMMARTKRKRYSARTIVETIRWDTDINDSDTMFKINDHFTPGMARLWMKTHGEQFPKFFELRG